ncbi:carbohydrate ABC transporter permease [Devosia sp.]|uniref:carbohydrate ABC transporter permease n=1 Tax=Devosia sp. TaxID=1871048 RepID=UPI003BAB5522
MTSLASTVAVVPRGPKPRHVTAGRIGIYAFLIIAAIFFLIPLGVMLMTSMKSMNEIRGGNIFALPTEPTFDYWVKAWSSACTGRDCFGLAPGFFNSVKITVISVPISIIVAMLSGYSLSFWKYRGSEVFFTILLFGAFVPYQVLVYPIIFGLSRVGLFGTLPGIVIVHTIFGLPILTLLFRNFFGSLPIELFKAARVDGAGFWRIFISIMLPMSVPITIVAVILQVTGIWNDFIFGLVFAGHDNLPMTVQLNNIVRTSTGTVEYSTNMAATVLTGAVPLIVYFVSGKWFVRGIAAGAVKG